MASGTRQLPDALDDLEREAILWLVGQRNFEAVVRAACDALVSGGSGEALATLAGEPSREPVYVADMDDEIVAALAEQGRPLPPRHTPEAQEAAVVAMARHALRGHVSPRDLARWAHETIGHDGVAMAQALVDLDDRFDTVDYSNESLEILDGEVLDFCRTIAIGNARATD